MFGTGLIIYLLSKELYVINPETVYAVHVGVLIVYGVKKYGPRVAAYADQLSEVRAWLFSKQKTDY